MSYIDFNCPENGNGNINNTKCVVIKIPAVCCGVKTVVKNSLPNTLPTSDNRDYYQSVCQISGHFPIHYHDIWAKWGPGGYNEASRMEEVAKIIRSANPIKNGCNCIKCGMNNQYAIPNTDKGYVCFECR